MVLRHRLRCLSDAMIPTRKYRFTITNFADGHLKLSVLTSRLPRQHFSALIQVNKGRMSEASALCFAGVTSFASLQAGGATTLS